MSVKYMKKFDYFVPCYYDFRKDHVNNTIVVNDKLMIDGHQSALQLRISEKSEIGKSQHQDRP